MKTASQEPYNLRVGMGFQNSLSKSLGVKFVDYIETF